MSVLKRNHVVILNEQLKKMRAKNKLYSIRAFARDVGISVTSLSLILSGKRPLSQKAAKQLIGKLTLTDSDASILLHSHPRRKSRDTDADYDFVSISVIEQMATWIHYAVLSLLETPGGKSDPTWIAKRLGVSKKTAVDAFERLVSLGLLQKVDGTWRQSGKSIKVENQISTAYTKLFHRDLLGKALESLDRDPVEVRNFSSVTFAMDPKNVAYAKKRIIEFRRNLVAELEEMGNSKEVYNLSLQVFPVSREIKE